MVPTTPIGSMLHLGAQCTQGSPLHLKGPNHFGVPTAPQGSPPNFRSPAAPQGLPT